MVLKEFKLRFDRARLLQDAKEQKGYDVFIDPLNGNPIEGWFIKHIHSGYGKYICEEICQRFNIDKGKPRFYKQDVTTSVGMHTDRGTLCSFNVLLTGQDDPIVFESGKIHYNCALINVSIPHSVPLVKSTRYLYKVSVFDKTFEELADVLPNTIQV